MIFDSNERGLAVLEHSNTAGSSSLTKQGNYYNPTPQQAYPQINQIKKRSISV
jgi:hypothetical protein